MKGRTLPRLLALGWALSWVFVCALWARTGDFDRAMWLAGRSVGYTMEVLGHTTFILWLFSPMVAGVTALVIRVLGGYGRRRPVILI